MSNRKLVVFLLGLMLADPHLAASADWKLREKLEAWFTYDSNIFKLSPSQITLLENPSAAETVNGRFLDMESADDLIFRPLFSLVLEGPGAMGKEIEIKGTVGGDVYMMSGRRNNLETVLSLEQSLDKRGGAVRIRGSYLPKYFQKNYLLDGVADSEGHVPKEDRVYAAGVHKETTLDLSFRHRILSKKRTGSFVLMGELGAGYADRSYDSSFRGRDRKTLEFMGELGLDFGKGTELLLRYNYDYAQCPVVTEVLLLDESEFGVDFNEDGDLQDLDIKVMESVDRSFHAGQFTGQLNFELSKKTALGFGVSWRLRNYSSQEPYDGYAGRTNKRWSFRADLDHQISSRLVAIAGYAFHNQKVGHEDITEDESDYTQHIVMAGMSVRF